MPKYNFISIFFRRGDLQNRKDMQPVGIVDRNDQVEGFGADGFNDEIYLETIVPLSAKEEILERIEESEKATGGYRWILDNKKFSAKLKKEMYVDNETKATKTKIKPIVFTNKEISKTYMKKTKTFKPVKDVNAWVTGAVTVGGGGGDTYATWTLAMADLGTLTGPIRGTQTTDLLAQGAATFSTDCDGNDVVIDFAKFIQQKTHGSTFFDFKCTNGADIDIKNGDIRFTATGGAVSPIFVNTCDWVNVNIHDNKIDGGGVSGVGINLTSAGVKFNVYNNIIHDCNSHGLSCYTAISADSVWEGNTVYNCTGGGIRSAGPAPKVIDNASYDNATGDYVNSGNFTIFSKCASSDASGSEAGLQNRTFATDFEADAPTVQAANLINWYKFFGNVNDSAGSDNGTVQGSPTYDVGYIGGANRSMLFDGPGTGDHVDLPDSMINSQTFTIATWVNLTPGAVTQWIIGFGNGYSNGRIGLSIDGSENLNTFVYDSAGGHAANGSTPIYGWNHIAMTYSNTELKAWVNGVNVATTATLGTITYQGSANAIGTIQSAPTSAKVVGDITDMRIYNSCLDITDMLQLADRSRFLLPLETPGALYGAGVNPTIVEHTLYLNGYLIITGDVDIGANGLNRSGGGTNVQATFNGETVNFVELIGDGGEEYLVYVDSSGNLKTSKLSFIEAASQIASGASVV